MKLYEITTLIIASSLIVWVGYGVFFEGSVETPPYKIINANKTGMKSESIKNLTVIKTNTTNQNSGFRQLFRMIDGNNADNKKIPMTAPVIQDQSSMMFIMPDNMTAVPQPNNPSVTIKQLGPLKVAVKSFRGSASSASSKADTLTSILQQNNESMTNKWFICQYNSPWVFPLLRKNEIWVVLN